VFFQIALGAAYPEAFFAHRWRSNSARASARFRESNHFSERRRPEKELGIHK